ncbi:hypothetical protein [Pedobacter jamesrossensis]|uniref:Uncharacterized protein n=1 Tax=Pedobacter jamesrossensis TaxID=1908238 RepID=A0ABV8NIR1_9SPHI
MKKSTKIILAVTSVILILASVFLYKMSKIDYLVRTNKNKQLVNTKPIDTNSLVEDTALNKNNYIPIDANFPKTGSNASDFVMEPYEIAMEDEGLLNDDGLEDVVLVLTNKNDSTDLRPTLVLLKQQTGGYLLYGVSWHTVGPAYINGDFQQYVQESVEIDSAKLKVNLYGYGGPIGNQFNTYKFKDNKLVLINLNLYNAGAGGQTYIDVDYLKNIVRIEDVNTMLEDMPSKISQKKIPKHKPYFFESDEGLNFTAY